MDMRKNSFFCAPAPLHLTGQAVIMFPLQANSSHFAVTFSCCAVSNRTMKPFMKPSFPKITSLRVSTAVWLGSGALAFCLPAAHRAPCPRAGSRRSQKRRCQANTDETVSSRGAAPKNYLLRPLISTATSGRSFPRTALPVMASMPTSASRACAWIARRARRKKLPSGRIRRRAGRPETQRTDRAYHGGPDRCRCRRPSSGKKLTAGADRHAETLDHAGRALRAALGLCRARSAPPLPESSKMPPGRAIPSIALSWPAWKKRD